MGGEGKLIYTDSRGSVVHLGSTIGQGGEATVYHLADAPDRLAKIYTRAARPEYPHKLAWMLAHPPENPTAALGHASLAWPDDLIYTDGRRLAGYTMAHIRHAVPLVQVFNPRLRQATLPDFNARYLHRAARNMSAALWALHSDGYVVGDLNESNILVTRSALVTMIDVDSFQVVETGGLRQRVHFCPVGKAEYTPPELHGKPLDRSLRSPEHDAFALGVLIFQLLMDGNHPFRAQWEGRGDPPPLEDRIAMGAFPYGLSGKFPVRPPRNAPGLERLHPELEELTKRCFIDGHRSPQARPSPAEWERALTAAEADLVQCARQHLFPRHLDECPYCAVGVKMPDPASRAAPRRKPEPQPRPAAQGAAQTSPGRRPFGNPQPASSRPRPQAARTKQQNPPRPVVNPSQSSQVGRELARWVARSAIQSWQQSHPGRVSSGSGTTPPTFSQAFVRSLVVNRPGRTPQSPSSPGGKPAAGGGPGAGPSPTGGSAPPKPPAGGAAASGTASTGGAASAQPATNPGPATKPKGSKPSMSAAYSGKWGAGSRTSSSRQMWVQPGGRRALLTGRDAMKSLTIGSGFGALAGILAGALVAMGAGVLDVPLGMVLLLSLGGALGGIARGWQPGFHSGEWIAIHVGWERFLEISGALLGAILGVALTLPIAWMVCPTPIGFVAGGWVGLQLGLKLWQRVGFAWNWERIWAGSVAAWAAFVCALVVRWLGTAVLGSGLERAAESIEPWIMVETGNNTVLVWLATGALAGAVGGAVAGFLTDIIARTFGLAK